MGDFQFMYKERRSAMKAFFNVMQIDTLLDIKREFTPVGTETVDLESALERVLAADYQAEQDIPGFDRATMDGYAVKAASTFGASEGNPAYLTVAGTVIMGEMPQFSLQMGQVARISTGGMLPPGADSVVMIEHTDALDDATVEVYRSVAPGQHTVSRDEDAAKGQVLVEGGCRLRAQELGILAACGLEQVTVFRRPRVGIISTGDEVIPISGRPRPGQVRDVNRYTLSALVHQSGGEPHFFGIVSDQHQALLEACHKAMQETDMVLISGGSSVGTRDLTVEVLDKLPHSHIMAHGVSIRPGKPTILARCGTKPFWGLPGHVTSAMVVFMVLIRPFLSWIGGCAEAAPVTLRARLSRNLASAQGRVDFVRVRLIPKNGEILAEPVLGGSGLMRTMVAADGLVAVDLNSEGLEQGMMVQVMLF
jgi:molybdopterin molybdotransferase